MSRLVAFLARAALFAAIGSLHGYACHRIKASSATVALMAIGAGCGVLIAALVTVYRTSVWRVLLGVLKGLGAVIYTTNVAAADVEAIVADEPQPNTAAPAWWWGSDDWPLGGWISAFLKVCVVAGAIAGFAVACWDPIETSGSVILDATGRWILLPVFAGIVGLLAGMVVLSLAWCWACRINCLLGGLIGAYVAVLIVWSFDHRDSAVSIWLLYAFLMSAQGGLGLLAGAGAGVFQVLLLKPRPPKEPETAEAPDGMIEDNGKQ